ncbi:MAG: DUF2630 family protein [Chloroflexi bacterium]|nr:DUF2630 family protein [Chloroflexota bacterium]
MNYTETFDEITRLTQERTGIWRECGKTRMTSDMRNRLHEIDKELPALWVMLRREVAANQKPLAERYW